jgi:hypothetical protein
LVRAAIAIIIGFILVIVEASIVAELKQVQSIDFGGIGPFISVWAMNFTLVFAILTEITNWFENKEAVNGENKNH